jgi:hypothetical protein
VSGANRIAHTEAPGNANLPRFISKYAPIMQDSVEFRCHPAFSAGRRRLILAGTGLPVRSWYQIPVLERFQLTTGQ